MNALAHSLCGYLCSRNNDIGGYWGIGVLCTIAKKERKTKFSFKIHPGELIRIYSCELTSSTTVTEKLVKFDLDSIEGRLSFLRMVDIRTELRNTHVASPSRLLRIVVPESV